MSDWGWGGGRGEEEDGVRGGVFTVCFAGCHVFLLQNLLTRVSACFVCVCVLCVCVCVCLVVVFVLCQALGLLGKRG